jgi:addiction module HigA family antidote
MTFSEALDKAWREKGWTQVEAAERLDIHRVTLSMLCNGRMGCTASFAMKLEQVFGVKAERWLALQAADDVAALRKRARARGYTLKKARA